MTPAAPPPRPGRAGSDGPAEFPGPILGGRVDIPAGRRRDRRDRRGNAKAHRSRGRRLTRAGVVLVAVLLVLAASGYGYLRYRWGQVATAACTACVPATGGSMNVLIVGSDSRAGETAAQAQQFGSAATQTGQRSDTIKVLHIDGATGQASMVSIPRDTYVTLSGVPASSGLAAANKINAAFDAGPDALVRTVRNTFGIPINHFVVVNFFGMMDAVDALGGISMDFPYPARDDDAGNNNSGLSIPSAGCQTLDGAQALALSRSRYYQYQVDGVWHADPTSDLGRIQRQDQVVSAIVARATSTYNPLTINAFLGSVTHDVTVDSAMSLGTMLSLARRYHDLTGSALHEFTVPTVPGTTAGGSSVLVVDPTAAARTFDAVFGGAPGPVVTPPLDASGAPVAGGSTLSARTGSAATWVAATGVGAPAVPVSTTTTTVPGSTAAVPRYDPVPC